MRKNKKNFQSGPGKQDWRNILSNSKKYSEYKIEGQDQKNNKHQSLGKLNHLKPILASDSTYKLQKNQNVTSHQNSSRKVPSK